MQSKVIVIGLALCFCTVTYGYSDCGSEAGTIKSIDISGCDETVKRCLLKRGTNATMEFSFTSNANSDSLKAVVHGIILGVPMPFELPNSDGCKDSGISCPIKSGETYKYVTTMPISTTYPRVTVDIKWELKDKDDKDVVCGLIPSKIV